MDILARGKYVIIDATAGEEGILTDAAAYLSGGKVVEVGDYESLKKKYLRRPSKVTESNCSCQGLLTGTAMVGA